MLKAGRHLYKIRTPLRAFFKEFLKRFVRFRNSYIQRKRLPVAALGSCWNCFWESKQTGAKATRVRTQSKIL